MSSWTEDELSARFRAKKGVSTTVVIAETFYDGVRADQWHVTGLKETAALSIEDDADGVPLADADDDDDIAGSDEPPGFLGMLLKSNDKTCSAPAPTPSPPAPATVVEKSGADENDEHLGSGWLERELTSIICGIEVPARYKSTQVCILLVLLLQQRRALLQRLLTTTTTTATATHNTTLATTSTTSMPAATAATVAAAAAMLLLTHDYYCYFVQTRATAVYVLLFVLSDQCLFVIRLRRT